MMIARLYTRQTRRIPTLPMMAALLALAALALIGIAGPAPAQAQTQAPSQTHRPSPDAVLIAKRIIELKHFKQNMFDPLVRGVIEKAKNEFMQTNFMWAKDLDEVAANMEKEYAPRANELLDQSARLYASYFSEAELKQILAFYQSSAGRKVIEDEPKVVHDSLAYAGQWGENFSQEVIAKMREEMKKRGHDI